MKSFRRIAFLSTIATYLLIFIGGLVRVSGAGLGCPDWPKCFGRWFPPTSISQLPADMDPGKFNFVLAWIEYFNRLVGMLIGILILMTAVLAIVYHRKRPRIIYPSLVALILVMYQGWQGGQVVTSRLQPFLISLHLMIAILIAGILIYVTLQAYYLENPSAEQEAVYPRPANLWIGLLGVTAIVQIGLGTRVRALFEILSEKFPLLSKSALIGYAGAEGIVHALLGLLVAGLTLHFGAKILRHSRSASGLVREGTWVMMLLISAQVVIGLILFMAGLPSLMQLFHLWIASLYFGTILMLYLAFAKNLRGTYGK